MKTYLNVKSTLPPLLSLAFVLSTIAKADVPSNHGMVLFGNKVTYASHLPMFHKPHNYQLIMKLSLSETPNSNTLKNYENLKIEGETFFTVVPEKVDLTQVIQGLKTKLTADLYHGHFERDGKKLGAVDLHIEKVIFSKKLDETASTSDFVEYLAFGVADEYYAVHLIYEKPSFDMILKTSQPYTLKAIPCRSRSCSDSIKVAISDDELPLTIFDQTTDSLPIEGYSLGGGIDGPVIADVQKVIYSEIDELSH